MAINHFSSVVPKSRLKMQIILDDLSGFPDQLSTQYRVHFEKIKMNYDPFLEHFVVGAFAIL